MILNLNITVNNGTISGKEIKNFNQLSFIKTFANYLKFNPTDKAMIERAKNTIWWVYKNLCEDTLRSDKLGYAFRNFSRGAVFCIEYLDTTSKQQFLYILEKNYGKWHNFWFASLIYPIICYGFSSLHNFTISIN